MKRELKCLIIDDELKAIELLSSRLKILFPDLKVIGSFTDWEKGLDAVRANSFDILFLDVSMPGKTGVDFLKFFPVLTFQVIFITAHSEYALEAIKFSATGYILKPIDDLELSFAVNKAIENINGTGRRKVEQLPGTGKLKIGVPNVKGIDYLTAEDILYFESINKYTKVVTATYSILSSYNLGEFKKIITEDFFFQVHRSYIINLYHIMRYETSGMLVMADSMQIPVSKTIRAEFLVAFGKVSRTAGLKK